MMYDDVGDQVDDAVDALRHATAARLPQAMKAHP
jgi:hypothetical protein